MCHYILQTEELKMIKMQLADLKKENKVLTKDRNDQAMVAMNNAQLVSNSNQFKLNDCSL